MPLPLLGLLKFAPAIFSAGQSIVAAFTGEEPPEDETPDQLAGRIQNLPPEQQAQVITQLYALQAQIQKMDTERFVSMNDGDADKIRATARPEIALRAMSVVETFALIFKCLFFVTIAEWLLRSGFAVFDATYPVDASLWEMIAKAKPVAEMIWVPLLGSFWACVEVIKKYMGCRERDKAQQFEIQAGRPLSSAAATVEAAGGFVSGVVKAFRK